MTLRDAALTLGLALAAHGTAGCGDVSSGDAHAGMTSLAPPSGAYTLWYLAPPWEVLENRPGHAVLRVPTSGDPLVAGGTAGAVVGLVIDELPGTDPLAWIHQQVTAAVATGATTTLQAEMLSRAHGPLADAAVSTTDGSVRYAALGCPGGRLVTLVFNAPTALADDPDITRMLEQVVPGPTP